MGFKTLEDLTGFQFGTLTVVARNPRNREGGGAVWNCKCDACGYITAREARSIIKTLKDGKNYKCRKCKEVKIMKCIITGRDTRGRFKNKPIDEGILNFARELRDDHNISWGAQKATLAEILVNISEAFQDYKMEIIKNAKDGENIDLKMDAFYKEFIVIPPSETK